MGCVPSKIEEKRQEVVSICRERKNKLKLVVERRHQLAEAHCRYHHSLYAMAVAIKLFVSRHSSPTSPFLITCNEQQSSSPAPTEQNVITNPMFHEQKMNHEAIDFGNFGESTDSSGSSEGAVPKDEVYEQKGQGFGYYYTQMPPSILPPQSPQRDTAWDFFNPFDTNMSPESFSSYWRSSDDILRKIREEEGIPELEEDEEGKKVAAMEEKSKGELEERQTDGVNVMENGGLNGVQGEMNGLNAIDSTDKGRELLEALEDIQDKFIMAYDSGKELSRMLEANTSVCLQSGLENVKENSSKHITWRRSMSYKPASCKSLLLSSSKKSSTWTEFKNALFDDHGVMNSGSHSLTLERLYAWEKKLYEEVKFGDSIRRIYEKKCSRLRNQDVKEDEELSMDKNKTAVKDLYARILVAVRSAESISKRIEKLRDEELQPQIVELLKGLSCTWKIMMESHETQNMTLLKVRSYGCPTFGRFSSHSHQLATLQLEAEIQSWHVCFVEYVAAQRQYVEALHGWLTKFLVPDVKFHSMGWISTASYQASGPALLMICHKWLSSMEMLSGKTASHALKTFSKDIRALWVQQEEEQQQKRKVDSLAKQLDQRTLAFLKPEMSKLLEYNKSETEAEHPVNHLSQKKDHLDMLRIKLEIEKAKHQNFMQETQRITLSGFQTGLTDAFKSLTEFSMASMKMYDDLVSYSEGVRKAENRAYTESNKDNRKRAETGFSI